MKKIAFIDSENFHNIDQIDLSEYQTVYYLFGAQEHSIKLNSANFNNPINLVVIPIKKSAKNNLDFHLCLYLGKLDESISKDIIFDIYSRDNGYSGVIEYLNNNCRECNKIYFENNTIYINNIAKSQNLVDAEQLSGIEEELTKLNYGKDILNYY